MYKMKYLFLWKKNTNNSHLSNIEENWMPFWKAYKNSIYSDTQASKIECNKRYSAFLVSEKSKYTYFLYKLNVH